MERKDLLYLGAFALLLFLFGSWLMPVTDPVESNYVETAKEMIAAGGLPVAAHLRELLVR